MGDFVWEKITAILTNYCSSFFNSSFEQISVFVFLHILFSIFFLIRFFSAGPNPHSLSFKPTSQLEMNFGKKMGGSFMKLEDKNK